MKFFSSAEMNIRTSWEHVLGKPISQDIIQPVKEEMKEMNCAICFKELKEDILMMECEHKAHAICIARYIN